MLDTEKRITVDPSTLKRNTIPYECVHLRAPYIAVAQLAEPKVPGSTRSIPNTEFALAQGIGGTLSLPA